MEFLTVTVITPKYYQEHTIRKGTKIAKIDTPQEVFALTSMFIWMICQP